MRSPVPFHVLRAGLRDTGHGDDMADVFISYAHEDKAVADQIASHLVTHGIRVWWDDQLAVGERFSKRIREEITAAHRVIVLWSPSSVESEWVEDEARLARSQSKEKLVPYMLEDCEVPLGLGIFSYRRLSRASPDLELVLAGLRIDAFKRRAISVFLSGPGDVHRELDAAAAILEQLNAEFGTALKFETIRWSLQSHLSASRSYAEDVPNPAEADVACFVFKNRLGTALPNPVRGGGFETGVTHEYSLASSASAGSGRPITQIFRVLPGPVGSHHSGSQSREIMVQRDRLKSWLNNLEGRPTLVAKDLDQFKERFEETMRQIARHA